MDTGGAISVVTNASFESGVGGNTRNVKEDGVSFAGFPWLNVGGGLNIRTLRPELSLNLGTSLRFLPDVHIGNRHLTFAMGVQALTSWDTEWKPSQAIGPACLIGLGQISNRFAPRHNDYGFDTRGVHLKLSPLFSSSKERERFVFGIQLGVDLQRTSVDEIYTTASPAPPCEVSNTCDQPSPQ